MVLAEGRPRRQEAFAGYAELWRQVQPLLGAGVPSRFGAASAASSSHVDSVQADVSMTEAANAGAPCTGDLGSENDASTTCREDAAATERGGGAAATELTGGGAAATELAGDGIPCPGNVRDLQLSRHILGHDTDLHQVFEGKFGAFPCRSSRALKSRKWRS